MRKQTQYSLRVLLVCVALVALVAMLYKEFYVPPLTRISGLSVEKQSERNSEMLFNDLATLHTVEQLLAHVAEGSTL